MDIVDTVNSSSDRGTIVNVNKVGNVVCYCSPAIP